VQRFVAEARDVSFAQFSHRGLLPIPAARR
jgi:hypothetical protein